MRKYLAMLIAMLLIASLSACALAEGVEAEAQSIGLTGVGNARELGGYLTEDGRAVKHGVFLRTAALNKATEADIQRLQDVYHLAVIADLRLTQEVEKVPDPEIPGAKYLHLGIIDEAALAETRKNLTPEDLADFDPNDRLSTLRMAMKTGIVGPEMYVNFLSHAQGQKNYAVMFQEILGLEEGQSLLFHCTQGKDRTGCAAMLILAALGVPEETILADFVLTNTYNAALIEKEEQMLIDMGVPEAERENYMLAMDRVDARLMVRALDWMKENYGSVQGYITGALDVTEAQIETLRERFLEPAEEMAAAA